MIRVRIMAENPAQERAIAELLAEDERIEITGSHVAAADVIIAANPLARAFPSESSIVFLSDRDIAGFDDQARAWLPLHVSAEQLIAAVLAAAQDLTVLTREQARRRLPARSRAAYTTADGVVEALTNREQQVLRMMADGLGNKEIAGHLGISDHTAKFHVAQVLAKLGAATRTEAVTIAIRRGLVPI
ncbi:MAG TPA: response regulator transcription factor [Bryobacteraceae bacterium]|jgi:DNA-binding NarL/FixJ family response regulator